MRVSRRTFLKGSGAIAAIAAAGVDLSSIAEAATEAKAGSASLGTQYVKSTCVHCVNFCGIEVKVENGVIRTVDPDKARADYYNVGLCPKGAAGVFNTYNPYRIKTPLKRTNPEKGPEVDPKWVEISWDEAFDTIAEKLKKIKAEDPRKLIWQHGHGKYLIGDQFPKAFAQAFGTPNLVHRTTTCEAARHVADEITWGYHGFLPDLDHCNLLLNFGGNYCEGEQWSRWLDHAAADAQERGMRSVVIEPRVSHTAAKADEWVPVRPGKDAVLLLGMAKVLIDDGLIDEAFLTTYTNAPQLVAADGTVLRDEAGEPIVFDSASNTAKAYGDGDVPALSGAYTVDGKEYKTAFQLFVDSLAEITPAYVEEIAGVPAATVERLARELGREAMIGATVVIDGHTLRYRPVALHTFRGLSAKEFGVQNWRAGLIVQMLLGSIDAVGGINLHSVYHGPSGMEPSKAEYPPTRVDLQKSAFFPHATHNVCQQVALTVLDPEKYGLPYVPEMQIFYATNRPVSTSDTAKQFESLKKTYNVVIDVVLTELATMADIVLPDLTYLESWHFSPTRYTPTRKHIAIRQPVANVYNIPHDAYSFIWEIAKRLDLRDAYIAAINEKWGLKNNPMAEGRDYSAREAVEAIWLDKSKGKDFAYALEHGFLGSKLAPEATYLMGVEDKFKGPGKPKMNFYADNLVGTLANIRSVVENNDVKAIDLAKYEVALSPFPRKEHAFPTPHVEAEDYPFYLITHKLMYRNQKGNTACNPILNALGSNDRTDENFIVINRATAEELGVADGELVTVETRIGKVTGKAKAVEGIRPDTVGISYHYGHVSPGMPAYARKGIDVNRVLELHPDLVSGHNSFNDTKCKVYAA
jgi:anaerobic selenocysteine-containing dehydrogenase